MALLPTGKKIIEKKLDPCVVLSPNGAHYVEMSEDEMKGRMIDAIWDIVEPFIAVSKNYHHINMTLDVSVETEICGKKYLKIS